MDVLGIPKELERRVDAQFKMLVPSCGPADSSEGEAIRAICRVSHRYYNDGDYWHKGYGIETAGSAAAFLMSSSCPVDVFSELNKSEGLTGTAYERAIHAATEKVVTFVEGVDRVTDTESELDMLKFKPKHELEDDFEEDGELDFEEDEDEDY